MAASTPFIIYRDRIVAVAGATRCYFTVDDLDAVSIRFVMAMCLCKREVDEGRLTGPFNTELAEQWARLILIGPSNLATGLGDAELAERLSVPVDQVALARAELGQLAERSARRQSLLDRAGEALPVRSDGRLQGLNHAAAQHGVPRRALE